MKKSLQFLLSLFAIALVTFLIMKLIPGDPFSSDRPLPEEVHQALLRSYGLDRPLHIQFFTYLSSLLKGDLGPSLLYPGRGVSEFICEGFPVSLQLGLQALVLALPIGIALGSVGALFPGRFPDQLSSFFTTLSISLPSFILATFLQYLFAIHLKWLPVARFSTFAHTLLPTFALAAHPSAVIARLVRANLIEILQHDFILTARAKGLGPLTVLIKHALPSALLPTIAYIGPLAAHLFTGSFVVEKIFGIPGLGAWLVQSIYGRDYPMILGLTLFYGVLLLILVYLSELLMYLLDPRLRRG
jgi:oligopeptide transport system permease protein